MKETIYTIPLNDAFHAEDECPFCRLERDAEQHALEFILGKQSSYDIFINLIVLWNIPVIERIKDLQ